MVSKNSIKHFGDLLMRKNSYLPANYFADKVVSLKMEYLPKKTVIENVIRNFLS